MSRASTGLELKFKACALIGEAIKKINSKNKISINAEMALVWCK